MLATGRLATIGILWPTLNAAATKWLLPRIIVGA
jgi:hypothetical protein